MLINKDSEFRKESTSGLLQLIIVVSRFIEKVGTLQCDIVAVMLP